MNEQKARDQAYIKQSNIHSVLKMLRTAQPVSRKDIIGLTGMSPTSITRIVGALLDLSLVVEGESTEEAAGRGRKAIQLRTDPDGLYTLGFLVERTSITICVMNFDNQILHTTTKRFVESYRSPDEIARLAYEVYQDIPPAVISRPSLLRGIGVSLSGIVNNEEGIVELSIQMKWTNENVRAAFEHVFGLPVWVENDVKAALIGEKDRLNIHRRTDAAYVYLGQWGISTANTSDGELLRGERNAAGEIAHMVLTPSDLQCDCGQYGCLQLHLVESYLVKRAKKIDTSITSIDGILAAYYQRLAWAEVLMGDFKRHLLLVVALLDSFCNPAKIIISGPTIGKLSNFLQEINSPDHVILAEDYAGASVRGVSIIAMQQTLLRRLSENDSD